ncbi:PIN domain-containing protein [Mucor lusitanicus]|uniref:PIN domain-containing protein n=2 Tax=Mucor circinelloides f. lusitanicus TaxID=29924 RepID=A0A162YK37_MUCCL|nr:PIN domain-containing protein [Mucor lusitanicus]OAC99056.1 hypothetical protein MUCCIDRAFT_185426 [Mucor lusitanicus CBS 277.49]
MSRHEDMEFMDIDGPEFIADVNNQIADIRASYSSSVLSQETDVKASAILEYTNAQDEPQNVLGAFQEICVLDTNFLLSKLGFLDTVLDLASENPGSLLVLLPWVVIRELDGLKQGNPDISAGARKAMRFIELRLRDKIVSLRGQKMNEVWSKDMLKNQNVKGDDRILDCCMYFQQITHKRVTLLSNDRNLCIKVMVHDVDSISAESVPKMEALLNRIAKKPASHSTDKPVSRYATNSWNHQAPQPQQHQQQPTSGEDYIMEIDDFYQPATTGRLAHHNTMEEDYDMMIDDDLVGISNAQSAPKPFKLGGTHDSKWAKATTPRHSYRDTFSTPAYLDDDPTSTAPKRPYRPQHTSIYNYDRN